MMKWLCVEETGVGVAVEGHVADKVVATGVAGVKGAVEAIKVVVGAGVAGVGVVVVLRVKCEGDVAEEAKVVVMKEAR